MASLKKLAGETVWYGFSNLAAKLLNNLMTPLITWMLHTPKQVAEYGDMSLLFSCISFVNVIFSYGMETAYFRFSASGEDKRGLFQTSFTSLLITTIGLSAIFVAMRQPIAGFTGIADHPEYITWAVMFIALDTMSAIPFARLRQEGRPRKYAFVRIAGILANVSLTVYFLVYSPGYVAANPQSAYSKWYLANNNVGYMFFATLAQALVTFLLLEREWIDFRFKFDEGLWKKMLKYTSPMIIVGLGGMINETIDRILLNKLSPLSTQEAKMAVGIYGANYKIAIFITLFITAFKMSAEPFFFKQAQDNNAPKTYARVMKWFVIVLCFAFLFTGLFLDVWGRYYIGPAYSSGNGVIPILLMANVCLGIYYNLAVWYKITDRMRMGMYITLVGAAITLVINIAFISKFGMYACAWATLAAYGTMMVLCYFLGQRYYPINYNPRKLLAYLGVMLALFFTEQLMRFITTNLLLRLGTACVLMYLFVRLVLAAEKKELKGMPFVGRFVKA